MSSVPRLDLTEDCHHEDHSGTNPKLNIVDNELRTTLSISGLPAPTSSSIPPSPTSSNLALKRKEEATKLEEKVKELLEANKVPELSIPSSRPPSPRLRPPTPAKLPSFDNLAEIPPYSPLSGTWVALQSHRSKVRDAMRSATKIDPKADPFLVALFNLPPHLLLARDYFRHCCTQDCGIQAFMASVRFLVKSEISDTLHSCVIALCEKLENHPEPVAFLLRSIVGEALPENDNHAAAMYLEISARHLIPGSSETKEQLVSPTFQSREKAREEISRLIKIWLNKLPISRLLAACHKSMRFVSSVYSALSATGLQHPALENSEIASAMTNTAAELYQSRSPSTVAALAAVESFAHCCYSRDQLVPFAEFLVGQIDAEAEAPRILLQHTKFISEPSPRPRRHVPLLKLNGLPTSLQGAALIGAVPAEEVERESGNFSSPQNPALTISSVVAIAHTLRPVYSDAVLHGSVISCLIAMILTPQKGLLHETLIDTFPKISGKIDFLHVLHCHLNYPANEAALHHLLLPSPFSSSPGRARLVKLLVNRKFNSRFLRSAESSILGGGAFGTVVKSKLSFGRLGHVNSRNLEDLAIKQVPIASSERSRIVAIFNEVTAMEILAGVHGCVPLLDFFSDGTNFNLVMPAMKKIPCDSADPVSRFEIFASVISTVRECHARGITHYDIKCGNLLEFGGEYFLGDFGEAHCHDGLPRYARGTECIQAPELVLKDQKDGLREPRANYPPTISDIWSIGCLLFELLTHEYLFTGGDWVQFFMKLSGAQVVLDQRAEHLIDKSVYGNVAAANAIREYLNFMLIADPHKRPSIERVCLEFKSVYATVYNALKDFPDKLTSTAATENLPGSPGSSCLSSDESSIPKPHTHEVDKSAGFYLAHRLEKSSDGHRRFKVLENVHLVLVEDARAGSTPLEDLREIAYLTDWVVDCRQNETRGSPFTNIFPVPHDQPLDEGICFDVEVFARKAVWSGSKILLLDHVASCRGHGYMLATYLIASSQDIGIYRAFCTVVNATLLPVSENALEGLDVLTTVVSDIRRRPREVLSGCACGAFWVERNEVEMAGDLESWLNSEKNGQPDRNIKPFMYRSNCSCSKGTCPNQGECTRYEKWLKKHTRVGRHDAPDSEVRENVDLSFDSIDVPRTKNSRLQWIFCGETPKSSAAALRVSREEVKLTTSSGMIVLSKRYRCEVCECLTHAELIDGDEKVLGIAIADHHFDQGRQNGHGLSTLLW